MADSMVCSAESKVSPDGFVDLSVNGSPSSLIQRRIEFHEGRKSFSGLGSGGGFRVATLNPSSNQQIPGFWIGKKDGSEVSESGLDPELSFGITVRKIGAGLENLGNTCFLNSVLQCLTYTEPLAAYLQSGKHQNSCHIAGFCALCAIQKHVSRALQSTGRILAPKDLVLNLRCISRNFRNARQEDAHEYMVNLLESMHKCCLPSGVPSASPSAYEKSSVHKIFGGCLQSQVKCMQCSYCSNTFDPFLDLSLEIANVESLQRALLNFTAAEQLDGGEKQYHCQRCKQKVIAVKQLTVHKAPYVLAVHLKRFLPYDPGEKIDKKIQFGPTLDLKPFVSGSYEGDLKYTLYGVLVHSGWSTHSGHYYCFVRTSSGMWYSLDDNRVVQVSEKTVLQQKAYMLFYVRDRRNVAPRKTVVTQNMKVNVSGNKVCLSINQVLHEPSQNGQIENRLSSGASPAVTIPKDAPNVGSTKDTLMNETSLKPNNASIEIECTVPKMDSVLEPSVEVAVLTGPALEASLKIPLSVDPPKELSVLNSKMGEFSPPPSVNGNSLTANTISGSVKSDNKKESSTQDVSDSVSIAPYLSDLDVISPNCNECQGSAVLNEETSQKIILDSNTGILSISAQNVPSGKTLKKIDPVGSIRRDIAVCNSLREDGDGGKKLESDDLVEVSNSPILTNRSVQKDCTTHKKSKKKLLKSQFASIHLGPNILFMASLGLRKKKKHKRSNCHSLRKKKVSKKPVLDEDDILSDLGHSTSEEAVSIPSSSERMTSQNGAVLASGKQLTKTFNSTSAANQSDSREPDSTKDGKRDLTQNGLLSMLTRGLDKSIVAQWDGIEFLSAQVAESNHETSSIGYDPDEWDEEYDRGKRKKVRHAKPKLAGPNPFQEIATMKSQWKKAKIEHSSSGNQPIRI